MAEDEEEDYMTMVIPDPARPAKESSIQRRARKQREGELKGRVKSKAEKKADDDAARDAALSTAIDSSNKGFKMMAKLGYQPGSTLGRSQDARSEPIHLEIKEGRGGVGLDAERKRKIREQCADGVKRVKAGEDDYRARMRLQREEARLEGQIFGTQKVLERLETESDADASTADALGQPSASHGPENGGQDRGEKPELHMRKPIKSINVLWRGLIRNRIEREREGRLRHELKHFNDAEDVYADEPRRDPLTTTTGLLDDLDDEDPELDDFNGLPLDERLGKILVFLRQQYSYCFWCKYRYPDPSMDGCPGLTEDDHD